MVFGLKRPFMSVQDSTFARPSPKFPSPPLFSVMPSFTPAVFFLVPKSKSEIRAGKLLVVLGHLQEELVGGRVRFEANISEYEETIYSL